MVSIKMQERISVHILIKLTAIYFYLGVVVLSRTSVCPALEYGVMIKMQAKPRRRIKMPKFSYLSSTSQKLKKHKAVSKSRIDVRMGAFFGKAPTRGVRVKEPKQTPTGKLRAIQVARKPNPDCMKKNGTQ